jgi:hypothetical protein
MEEKMKYLVLTKCRLTDRNVYLNPREVFDPKDENYEQTSRSLAAAIRAQWIRKISDAEAKVIIEKNQEAEKKEVVAKAKVEVPKAVQRKITDGVTVGAHDMEPEDLADEVTPDVKNIVAARDDRRNAKVANTAKDIKDEIKMKIRRKKMKIGKKS